MRPVHRPDYRADTDRASRVPRIQPRPHAVDFAHASKHPVGQGWVGNGRWRPKGRSRPGRAGRARGSRCHRRLPSVNRSSVAGPRASSLGPKGLDRCGRFRTAFLRWPTHVVPASRSDPRLSLVLASLLSHAVARSVIPVTLFGYQPSPLRRPPPNRTRTYDLRHSRDPSRPVHRLSSLPSLHHSPWFKPCSTRAAS